MDVVTSINARPASESGRGLAPTTALNDFVLNPVADSVMVGPFAFAAPHPVHPVAP
jgi:hypothetical protein